MAFVAQRFPAYFSQDIHCMLDKERSGPGARGSRPQSGMFHVEQFAGFGPKPLLRQITPEGSRAALGVEAQEVVPIQA